MLHSALLPRAAYLAPGYHLAGYIDEAQHTYAYLHHQQQQQLEESYAAQQRVLAWDTSALIEQQQQQQQQHHAHLHEEQLRRASTPSPLDLSLKPPPTPSTSRTDECEPIEVDDEEDRRSREEARSQHSSESGRSCYRAELADVDVVVDELDSQRSCSSAHSGYQYEQRPDLLALYPEASQHKQLLLMATSSPSQHLPSYHKHQQQQQQQLTPSAQLHQPPMTPPSTPSPPQCPRRKPRDEESTPSSSSTGKQSHPDKPRAKKKHVRKLKFDEDTSSPVSGTVILGPDEAVVTGDIDPAFNIVEVTEEARAELAKIENRLGPYQCKLCRQLHDDAFQLAQHRCSRIAHVEYRCPECDKRFSCPANLASHRRWHKPRPASNGNATNATAGESSEADQLACTSCDMKFSRQAALRKHVASQHPHEQNNNNNNNNSSAQEVCKRELAGAAAAMEMA